MKKKREREGERERERQRDRLGEWSVTKNQLDRCGEMGPLDPPNLTCLTFPLF